MDAEKSAADYFEYGITCFDEGEYEEAVGAYHEALKYAPEDAIIHFNLGLALHEMNEIEAAMEAYREAIRFQPDYAAAHLNLGVALYDAGRFEEAIEAYRTALRLEENPDTYYNLGLAYQELERFPEAVAAFRRYLEFDQDSEWAEEARNLIQEMEPLLPKELPPFEPPKPLRRVPEHPLYGTVKWFNAGRGYGFIEQDRGGEDVFVHRADVRANGTETLFEGQRVIFDMELTPKGPRAINVVVLPED